MSCHGNGAEHCCWIDGEQCRFLETDTVPGRHWVCGLRRELGSWDRVHLDERYLRTVRPTLARVGQVDCGDFNGVCCDGSGRLQCCYEGLNG